MTTGPGVLTRRMRIVGWLCAFGLALMIIDLVRFLPDLPQHWWTPERPPQLVGNSLQFDFRVMWADLGLAWIGSWGYLGALVWIPVAVVKLLRARRRAMLSVPADRVVFATVCTMMVAITALVHLTPLRYPRFNFLVL